jgi:decaprenyl-phosphate phosphoribosyltransferase
MKNLLVVVAPLASGALVHGWTALTVAAAVLAFALAEAGADALHDAAGDVLGWTAVAAAVVLAFAIGTRFGDLAGGYLLFRLAVGLRLGRVGVAGILAVPGGMFLRIVAGSVATGAYLPASLLLATICGGLFLLPVGWHREQSAGRHQEQPAGFAAVWLQQMRTLALAGVVLAYASWAFGHRGRDVALPLLIGSVVPLVAALVRYSGGRDRWLALYVAAWAAVSAGAIYLS